MLGSLGQETFSNMHKGVRALYQLRVWWVIQESAWRDSCGALADWGPISYNPKASNFTNPPFLVQLLIPAPLVE